MGVWAGLVGGPLSPKAAQALESEILARLEDEAGVALVDPGGRPLNRAAERHLAAEHRALFDAGIEALLAQDYERALRELDRAGALFERRLAGQEDHRLRYETLLAKATAYLETDRKEAARKTLRELAALEPADAAPRAENHPAALVALYAEARSSLGAKARLRLVSTQGELRLRWNGRALAGVPAGPLELAPGRHLLWVEAGGARHVELVELGPGEERSLELPVDGPEARQRRSFLEELAFRPRQCRAAALKLLRLSGATALYTGWVRPEADAPVLHLARLAADGGLETAGRTPVGGEDRALAALVRATLEGRRRGGFEVTESGQLVPRPQLDDALGLGRAR